MDVKQNENENGFCLSHLYVCDLLTLIQNRITDDDDKR
mgnify:CR=1 FL=1